MHTMYFLITSKIIFLMMWPIIAMNGITVFQKYDTEVKYIAGEIAAAYNYT